MMHQEPSWLIWNKSQLGGTLNLDLPVEHIRSNGHGQLLYHHKFRPQLTFETLSWYLSNAVSSKFRRKSLIVAILT